MNYKEHGISIARVLGKVVLSCSVEIFTNAPISGNTSLFQTDDRQGAFYCYIYESIRVNAIEGIWKSHVSDQ